MKAVIVAHGYFSPESLNREINDADLVICSDGGSIYAKELDIAPNVIIGDMDSISKEVLDYFKSKGTKHLIYPKDKDFTDTEICIDYAIEQGANTISIVSGIGSRIDHSLINIGLLNKIINNNVFGYIATDESYIYLCNNKIQLNGEIGDTLSLIPLTSTVEGITTYGLKYPLKDGVISIGQSLGVSNEFVDKSCIVEVKKGTLIVIKQNLK